jgi:anti-sigma regulatory factor (Ser/Thr protein kinase)
MEEEMAATGGAPRLGAGPLDPLAARVPELRWRRVFPGEERQLGVVRRWVESLLPECPARDDVACVVTELGTNAIRHTASGRGGWFVVEVAWYRPVVRVAVTDDGAAAGPRVIDDPAGEHGRGLLVVAGLSARTGVCGDHRGRLVWADVPWDDAKPASSLARYEAAIGEGQAGLASRFAGATAWFGRSTLQWWALAGDELVTAPSAQELAILLDQVLIHDRQAAGLAPAQLPPSADLYDHRPASCRAIPPLRRSGADQARSLSDSLHQEILPVTQQPGPGWCQPPPFNGTGTGQGRSHAAVPAPGCDPLVTGLSAAAGRINAPGKQPSPGTAARIAGGGDRSVGLRLAAAAWR